MPDEKFFRYKKAIQYTGINGPEVCAFGNMPLMSDDGTTLVVGVPPWETLRMNVGDWYDNTEGSQFSNTEYFAHNVRLADALRDTDSTAAVTALQAAQATLSSTVAGHTTSINSLNTSQGTQDTAIAAAAASASAASSAAAAASAAAAGKLGKVDIVSISVPILLLGGTADRAITWNRPFSNANYDLSYALDASTLGRVTPSVVTGSKTATGITIRLTAGLAVSVLGVVHVLGIGA